MGPPPLKLKIATTNRFEKKLKQSARRGKDLSKFSSIAEQLAERQQLDARFKMHKLKEWGKNVWTCHIQPDLGVGMETGTRSYPLYRHW